MESTSHRSTDGVRAYKRISNKVKELSFNLLNQSSANKLRTEGGSEAVVADTVKLDLACVEPEKVKPASQLGSKEPSSSSVPALLTIGHYYSTTMCQYWDM